MTTQTDRLNGVVGNPGFKTPCRVAASTNITLSGEQTIDGVAVVADDRVLVTGQTDATENGIYVAAAGAWVRAKDWDGPYDIVQGSLVYVVNGTANAGFYYVTTANPITIGTTSVTIAMASTVLAVQSAFAQSYLDDADGPEMLTTLGLWVKGADIVANTTTDLGAVDGTYHDITGTATITGFGTTGAGRRKILQFDAALTLTHNASSLILPGNANILTAAGDQCEVMSLGSGNWIMLWYTREQGLVLDEDDMASDSATVPPSQQSVKAYVDATLFSQISGLIQSNDATDATNDISVSPGSCADSTNSVVLSLSAARIKRLDASWVTGTNQGGLSSSLTIADTDYHIFIIRVAGVDDIGFDTSITAANLVADHSVTHYRRIGWFARGGNSAGVIDQFVASESAGGGLNFLWSTPKLDVNLNATLTTARRTDAIRVPLDYSVTAHINAAIKDSAATQFAYIHCPDQADLAPSDTVAPLMNLFSQTGRFGYQQMFIRTSATGTIAARASTATVDAYQVVTIGFEWSRR